MSRQSTGRHTKQPLEDSIPFAACRGLKKNTSSTRSAHIEWFQSFVGPFAAQLEDIATTRRLLGRETNVNFLRGFKAVKMAFLRLIYGQGQHLPSLILADRRKETRLEGEPNNGNETPQVRL